MIPGLNLLGGCMGSATKIVAADGGGHRQGIIDSDLGSCLRVELPWAHGRRSQLWP